MILVQIEYNRCLCLMITGSHCEVNAMQALGTSASLFLRSVLKFFGKPEPGK